VAKGKIFQSCLLLVAALAILLACLGRTRMRLGRQLGDPGHFSQLAVSHTPHLVAGWVRD
jgi:hypothetical protein